MNTIQKSLLAIALTGTLGTQATSWYENLFTPKTVMIGSVAALSGYALLRFGYNQIQQYAENRTINESVDSIIIALTPNRFLGEPELRKKAVLINMRKRVMATVTSKVGTLSPAHQAALNQQLKVIDYTFTAIDAVRAKNPFEDNPEYTNPSRFQQLIESNFVQSIILKTKPNSECTPQELAQKKSAQKRSALIGTKVIQKLSLDFTSITVIKNLQPIIKILIFFLA